MKKLLLLFFLFLSVHIQAADKVPGVIVELSSGGTIDIALANNPKMVYDGQKVKLTSSTENAEYEPSEIKKVKVGEVDAADTGINGIQDEKSQIKTEGGFVRLTGFPANETISIYSLKGVLISTFRTDANGSCTIDLRNLPSGISIIKTQNESIKITRR